MDHSPSGIAAQNPCKEPVHPSRVLTSTSGNAQVFAGNSKVSSDLDSAIKQGSRHPSPLPILGSNDRSAPLSRLAARKAKRVSLLSNERQYLQSEQYQRYRTRKRQDIGDDGKPVWPDHLEESFQNGKTSQLGFSMFLTNHIKHLSTFHQWVDGRDHNMAGFTVATN